MTEPVSGISNNAVEGPSKEILSNPALLFLYYRVEQILGIKVGSEALIKLNAYLEKSCGDSFIEKPADYEYMLTSRERVFEISNIVTVNETYFFREGVHFDLLINFLPQLIKLNRPIQICSAATSIGCEAYSIAMLLDYQVKNGLDFDFAIDAFDISAEAIETAKNAHYTSNAMRNDGINWKYILDSYLISDKGEYTVPKNIRSKVRFFPHNIMRGLDKKYDVIFFRNALIYFSTKNRLSVMNNLAESLFNNGLLFLGISETSSAHHPLLISRHLSDVFYFEKIANNIRIEQPEWKQSAVPVTQNVTLPPPSLKKENIAYTEKKSGDINIKPVQPKNAELTVDCAETAAILETEEGMPNAKKTLNMLEQGSAGSLSGAELAASAVYFFNVQNFNCADMVLSCLEKCNNGHLARFLRGEFYFLQGNVKEAEHCYEEAAVKDKNFWPAFYRIASLAAEGNRTRYEYKIKKAIESIELSHNAGPDNKFKYECFMGGFSPDYFRLILEKKLM